MKTTVVQSILVAFTILSLCVGCDQPSSEEAEGSKVTTTTNIAQTTDTPKDNIDASEDSNAEEIEDLENDVKSFRSDLSGLRTQAMIGDRMLFQMEVDSLRSDASELATRAMSLGQYNLYSQLSSIESDLDDLYTKLLLEPSDFYKEKDDFSSGVSDFGMDNSLDDDLSLD
jgi:hypothetical protein